jgi:hypothetical protein
VDGIPENSDKTPLRVSQSSEALLSVTSISYNTYALRALLALERGRTYANLRYLVQIH